MGYDLYGLNPIENTEEPPILSKFKDNDGWNNWEKMTEKDKDAYCKADTAHQEENPGIYFRANVWFWRPLWSFVCGACHDILSEKDMNAGCFNSGERVSKTKSVRVASRLRKLDKGGVIQTWEDEMMKHYNKANKHNKNVQKVLDAITKNCKEDHGDDVVPMDYPEPYKTQWNEAYDQRDWGANYPPSREFIMEFAKFAEQSGGFEIC